MGVIWGPLLGPLILMLISGALTQHHNRPPRFLIDGQTEIVLRLKEGSETPVGTLIYRLRGFDPDGDPLTFGIRESSGSDVLRITPDNDNEALIYLRKELDRETRDEYALVLTLTDGRLGEGNYITQSLLLLVEDVNDNAPVFKPHPTAINVREDSPPRVLAELEATDLDEGPYGQVVYSLVEQPGDEGVFSVSTVGGRGVVRLLGHLDFETKSLYQLRVLATDRSNNDRVNTGTAALLVRVEDVEDSPPEFTFVPPLTRISEDVPVGTAVLVVKAVDGDRGVNNRIVYSISQGGGGVFGIDATSGVVRTQKPLDREDTNTPGGAYVLEIMAQEQSRAVTPGPVTRAEVTVLVTDVNDETPRFRGDNYVLAVSEGAQATTPLVFLGTAIPEVYDHDQGNNGTFELFLNGDGGVFDVTPNRGINEAAFLIRVKNPAMLDYEQRKTMNFTLVAKEIVPSKNPRFSTVPIVVYIKDVNDNFPEFTEPAYEVSVPENSKAGTTVAWVQAMDEDSGNFGTQGIRYTSLGGNVADMLHLDPVSGILTIRSNDARFDRELADRHYLTVEARDDLGRGNRNTVQLIVHVTDENDNTPEFVLPSYEARLIENQPDFSPPLKVLARDLDLNGTVNSEVWYSISGGEYKSNFTIDSETGRVRPVIPLDFERVGGQAKGPVKAMQLIVRASDRGEPTLTSEVPLTVYLHDVNDHAPVFEKLHYTTSVPEDLAPGSAIAMVKAYDRDGSSPNNVVVYRLAGGQGDKFVMDSESGAISVAAGASLDPDRTEPRAELYVIKVLALDGGIGSEQRSSQVTLEVAIEDINNKAPKFLDPGTIVVRENTPVGETVVIVRAVDPDAKPVLRYRVDAAASEARGEEGTLVNQADYNFTSVISLGPVDGHLKIAKLLDREKVDIIRLALTVEDLAASRGKQISSAVLTILVEDENDNAPMFRQPMYRVTVAENAPPGTVVTRLIADDADKNRTIHYALESAVPTSRRSRADIITAEPGPLLHLDPESGELRVASRIDRENTDWLNVTVKATDNGIPPRNSFAQVFVQVLDENDNNPYFVDDAVNITVREDAPVGTEIARLAAMDADTGDFGKITYLLDRRSSQGKFEMDADSGALTVASELNREEQSFYMLVIEAWDNYQFGYAAGESRNAFKQIGVNIVDVNDESPVFESRGGCASVTEFHEPGELVTVVKAVDKDDPTTPNGRLKFEIEHGNDLGLFSISNLDHTSARISVARPLHTLYGNYSLVVRASDEGIPPNSALDNVKICVTDFNDHAPHFVAPPRNLTVRVPENATLGSVVVEVRAEDEDIGANGAVRYRLRQDPIGYWKTFDIDHVTGIITLKLPLDREKQKMYEIRVEAYDLGIPTPLSSDLDIAIYVSNINDFEPQFVQNEFRVNFTENMMMGEEIARLPDTVDRDELDMMDGQPPPVCYFIVAGNTSELFILDPISHELTVSSGLDREAQSEHVLLIRATESCGAPLARVSDPVITPPREDSLLMVRVTVLDQNDNAPRFTKKTFTGGVTTDADFGTTFMHVKAVDADSSENANVSYFLNGRVKMSLSEGLDNVRGAPFIVDRETGAISLNFDPQRGMKGYFEFKVIARDTAGLQDEARVLAYLLREDQRVRFVLRQHPAEVREKIDKFRDVLGSVTGAVVNADEFKLHENHDGSVDKTRTDLYLHFVNGKDNSVLEVQDALRKVDSNIEKLDPLFKEFNVLDTQPAEAQLLLRKGEMDSSLLVLWLAASSLLLFAVLAVTVAVCLSQRSRYLRQIKAATAIAFGDTMGLTRPGGETGGRVPNTNKHSSEGSNPMWMQSYENEWFKDDEVDQRSTCSPSEPSSDSLDENAVTSDPDDPGQLASPSATSPVFTRTPRPPSSKAHAPPPPPLFNNKPSSIFSGRTLTNIIVEEDSMKEQNDLNRTETFRQNLYMQLDKLSQPLNVRNLETTEL